MQDNRTARRGQAEGRGGNGGAVASAALNVASANLATELDSASALDGKASLLLTVNVALISGFVGWVVGRGLPMWTLICPGIVAALSVAASLMALWPHGMLQFPHPRDLQEQRRDGFDSDSVVWSYVTSIGYAIDDVADLVSWKAKLVTAGTLSVTFAVVLSLLTVILLDPGA